MANVATPSVTTSDSWFTPKRLLAIFCTINLLTYIDRGAIASNGVNGSPRTCDASGTCSSGSGIQGDFNLTNFEDGFISSAYTIGLLLASPVFASLAKRINPCRLLGVGLTVWTVAIAFCGFSFNFWSIAISRMLVGFGEASFISFAPPFIDDNAPITQRTAWLGAFYMCIPTGVSIGFMYGGLIGRFGWRYAFWVEAILMLPFAILGFVMKPLQLKGISSAGSKIVVVDGHRSVEVADDSSKPSRLTLFTIFGREMKVLFLEKVYMVNVLGYITYACVLGSYSYWGPRAANIIYDMSNADFLIGALAAPCGILGTLAGGFVLDRLTSTIPNAFKFLSLVALFGGMFCFGAYCFKSEYAFLALLSIGQLLLFAGQAPVNFISLHCVKPSIRPLSMAMATTAMHVFGDVLSPSLVGLLQDNVNNWRETVLILTSVMFLAAGVWFAGVFLHSVDRYDEDTERSSSTPLLEEN